MHVERSDASDRWCGLVAPTMGAATTIDHGDGKQTIPMGVRCVDADEGILASAPAPRLTVQAVAGFAFMVRSSAYST